MKTFTLTLAALSTLLTSSTFAQCLSGGHRSQPTRCRVVKPQPIYRPAPAPQPPPPAPKPAPVLEVPQMQTGETLQLSGNFGSRAGSVYVKIDSLILEADLIDWKPSLVVAQLPTLPLADAAPAVIAVVAADGKVAQQLDITLVPGIAVPPTPQKPTVTIGERLTLDGNQLGSVEGHVQLRMGTISLNAVVEYWSQDSVRIQLPSFKLPEPVDAAIIIGRADGSLADRIDVLLTPKTSNVAYSPAG